MKSTLFRDQVVNTIRKMDTTVPLDIAMMQTSISKATVIDVGPVIGRITRKILNASVDFGNLYQAAPPAGQDNLFVEFRARDAFPPPYDLGWYGVHVVPFATAAGSIMFKNVAMPDPLKCWPQVYSTIVYRFKTNELTTAPYSIVFAVDPRGSVSMPGFFNIVGSLDLGFDAESVRSEMVLIIYSILQSFSTVSTGNSLLVHLLGDKSIYRMESVAKR